MIYSNETIKINKKTCFECGNSPVEMHHIIPESKGGTKTIPLCVKCHGLVHDRDFVTHRRLRKEGIERAKKENKYKGRKKGTGKNTQQILDFYQPIVDNLLNYPKLSLFKIAELSGEKMGRVVAPNTVRKVKNLLK
jgi:hypothetical protein